MVSVLIEQCKTHLNVNVGEADLKEVILSEITENKDIYHSKVDINNLSPIFENLSSVNHLDAISEAVSAQFHCDIVRLKPSGSKDLFYKNSAFTIACLDKIKIEEYEFMTLHIFM